MSELSGNGYRGDQVLASALHDPSSTALADAFFQARADQHLTLGSTVTPAFYFPYPSSLWGYREDVDPAALLESYPARPPGVRWNGDRGSYEWSDAELRKDTYAPATALYAAPKLFRKKVFSLPEETQLKFRRT